MKKKVVITGATGTLGTLLFETLREQKYEITIFTQSPDHAKQLLPKAREYVLWDYTSDASFTRYFEGIDGVIHLAGASVAGRTWTEEYKREILESRELSTRALVNAMSSARIKPKVLVSASAVGIYSETGDADVTEEYPLGEGFLSEVCKIWEAEALRAEFNGIRRVSMRIGIVMSLAGGALTKMIPAFKSFLGGPLGNGKQWFSWIHETDVVNAILFALQNEKIKGAVNTTAPNPVRMKEFAKTLGAVMKRPSFFPVPKSVLKLVMGEAAESMLASQKVIPRKLLDLGFTFRYPLLKDALISLGITSHLQGEKIKKGKA